ncbi:hypothetical protein [Microcella alkaliphila]|uniref:hypothetical protein n=1 Tax=Microcella alkaliphila TaxID=279828 RepID=UPI003BAE3AFF
MTRRRRGRGYSYSDADGRPVTDPATLERITSLVIPPAWTDVWICADERGHLQAAGTDADGRRRTATVPLPPGVDGTRRAAQVRPRARARRVYDPPAPTHHHRPPQ